MTASIRMATLLRRAGLLTGLLAVVAGILGMHVMTAGHSAHSSHSATGHSDVRHSDATHSAEGHADQRHQSDSTLPSHPTASCAGSCPGMQSSGPPCIPLANTGSLVVFPPEGRPDAEPGPAAGTDPAGGYSYVLSGPTPCELSISRT